MTDPIDVSPFDNDISILHKWGNYFGTPTRFLLVRPDVNNPEDQNIPTRHEGRIYERILDVVDRILAPSDDQDLPDAYMATYNYLREYLPLFSLDDIAFLIYWSQIDKGQPEAETIERINDFYNNIQLIRDPTADKTKLRPRFPDVPTFQQKYDEWTERFNKLKATDVEILERLRIAPEILAQQDPLPVTTLVVNGVTVRLSPTVKKTEQPVTPTDGIDIFNESLLSMRVPFIEYNSELNPVTEEVKNKYFKIYHGDTPQDAPKLDYILPSLTRTSKPNTIYMTVWTEPTDTHRLTKKSFQSNRYDLEANQLIVSSPVTEEQTEDLVIDRVRSAFPSLEMGTPTEISISGYFYMLDVEITDYSLNDLIMTDSLMSQYLYIDETNQSHANRIQHKIRFKSLLELYEGGEEHTSGHIKNFSSVDINLKQHRTGDTAETFTLEDGTKVEAPPKTPYLEVRITKADSREVAQRFIEIFRRLIRYYLGYREELDLFYQLFIPSLTIVPKEEPKPEEGKTPTQVATLGGVLGQTTCKKGPGAPARTTGVTRIARLEQLAPDVFVKGYARKCQCRFQPDIIAAQDVDTWKAQTFEFPAGVIQHRQVLEFPADNPKYYFVCPGKEFPFPGVKDNDLEKNKHLYPYIPCCFKTDHMNPGARSLYNQVYHGIKKKSAAHAKTTKIRRDEFLDTHRMGDIPATKVASLLLNYSPDSTDIVRYGVPRTVNSLIHCVLTALDIPEYMGLQTDEEREDYAIEVRRSMIEALEMNVFRQELFDFDDEAIEEQILRMDLFLDPQIYYRGLEEMYNINIYTFIPTATKEDPTNGKLEIPRAKLFHTRPLREFRRDVVIYKHRGASSDELRHPHCELVVDLDSVGKTVLKLFGEDMNELLHETLLTTAQNLVVSLENQGNQAPDVIVRSNPYSRVDFYSIIERKGTSQIVDEYGKVRAFMLMSPQGPLVMTVPSCQPENLPQYRGPLPSVPVETAVSLFGEPTAVTLTNNQVTGLWYPVMDLPTGVHVVVNPTDQYNDRPEGPPNPVAVGGINVVARLRKLQRTLDVLMQIVRWLFIIAQITAPTDTNGRRKPVTSEEFSLRYFSVEKPPSPDSAEHYDLSEAPRLLPVVESVEEGIDALEEYVPSLLRGRRIIFYSETFKEKVVQKLAEFYVLFSPLPLSPIDPTIVGEDWVVPAEITGLFSNAMDFIQQPSVGIFVGEDDITKWIAATQRPSYESIVIRTKLDISYGLQEEPYIYSSPDSKVYMVQNVHGGTFERAIQVAYQWFINKINMGAAADPFVGNIPVHVIYSISQSGNLSPFENNAEGADSYLQLLLYGEGLKLVQEGGKIEFVKSNDITQRKYAAMLPLL